MPQQAIPPGFCKLDLIFQAASVMGSSPMVSFAFAVDTETTNVTLWNSELGDALSILQDPLDSGSTVIDAKLRLGEVAPPYFLLDLAPGSNSGSVAGNALAPNTAFLVTKTTATPGRQGRGRMYLPWVPEDAVDDFGQVDVTARGNVQTAVTDFVADLQSSDLVGEWVVLHELGSPLEENPSEVLSVGCSALVATQRRRLRR